MAKKEITLGGEDKGLKISYDSETRMLEFDGWYDTIAVGVQEDMSVDDFLAQLGIESKP